MAMKGKGQQNNIGEDMNQRGKNKTDIPRKRRLAYVESRPEAEEQTVRAEEEWASPFSEEILADILPNHYKPINMEYDGSEDPEVHMARFETVVMLHQYSEGIKCRIFFTTLTGLAQQWFRTLDLGSIYSFAEFHDLFMCQFASSRRMAKTAISLMEIRQEPGETLKEYASRFTMASLAVPIAEFQIKGYAFVRGLKQCAFFEELQIHPPANFDEIMAKLPGYIQLEETKAGRRAESERNRPKKINTRAEPVEAHTYDRSHRTSFRGLPSRFSHMAREAQTPQQIVNNVNQFTDFTPMNTPQEKKFNLIKDEAWFRPPPGFERGQPKPGPNNLLCLYHNAYGHPTQYCHNLKRQIEILIRQGRLDRFVKQSPPVHHQDRGDNFLEGQQHGTDKEYRANNVPPKERRVVHMIIGEENADLRNIVHPHSDALVFSAEVANCIVHRIFVDTGSAVNIIYKDCLTAIALNASLKPVGAPLYGFTGEAITPIGSIEFPMIWGQVGASRTRILRFLVVDLPKPSYNIIVGRLALDAFQAMISMYYLKMKFPLEEGCVGEVCGNQILSKECHVRSLTAQTSRKRARAEEGQTETVHARAGLSARAVSPSKVGFSVRVVSPARAVYLSVMWLTLEERK
ncbi:uncharacterized protein LOC131022931 [Salvia miltiorrhiza]|uniref:uncharacterized protein LOC131022931 n=1 Tax=Salvia miltiorrhiza TaxID=226208 RepID=UPI0025ACC184|nr:uncharacterized protein LOC131022931 [Salvia miltiorrhiza]